jgi:GyrI-like small molecule binding domain
MHAAFQRTLGRWLPASGEEIDDRPCIEIYLNDPSEVAEAQLRTELCIPLRSRAFDPGRPKFTPLLCDDLRSRKGTIRWLRL